MNKVDKQIQKAKISIDPSSDFVDQVMDRLEAPQNRQLGWLKLVPIFGLIAISVVGFNLLNNQPSTVSAVETDLAEIEVLLDELTTDFADIELDEVQ